MHPKIKTLLGYRASDSEAKILTDWKQRTGRLCKPCWELKYCPYGPLVEEFPLPPLTRQAAVEHHQYLIACLKDRRLPNGRKLDRGRRRTFPQMIDEFDEGDYPEAMPSVVDDASCRVFGHMCPVFFVAEPLTETRDRRKHSRSIPREVMLKVVRRDGQICQECHQPVPDDQVEFDHIIPYAKGGISSADNVRLLCRDCNRKKSDSLERILSPDPIMHFAALTQKAKKKK
jgi:HNH endonuclease